MRCDFDDFNAHIKEGSWERKGSKECFPVSLSVVVLLTTVLKRSSLEKRHSQANLCTKHHQVSIMNHPNGQSGGNRGYGGNYPQNNGQQGQYPSSGNNMQYNYSMNQPYANTGYTEQYYPPQDPYQQNYGQGSYEEDDYDNLDEIERVSIVEVSICSTSVGCIYQRALQILF